jgi:hypothetical protein
VGVFFRRLDQNARRPSPGQVSLRIPAGVDWRVHRIAISSYYKDPLATILDHWTLNELADAHLVLDCLEEAEARARAQE